MAFCLRLPQRPSYPLAWPGAGALVCPESAPGEVGRTSGVGEMGESGRVGDIGESGRAGELGVMGESGKVGEPDRDSGDVVSSLVLVASRPSNSEAVMFK
ncbi:hypothetical protein BC937DRAFT_94881 [Endogone sp. FLAS-F59071]|nr:hypothetical protein BC937DRAFT_94881 [Endogone sp. FLAS-F59071]|eukprot:RUS20589.1 hypothetical protein BC937DRAFT_94881 [Endogone sp. FLAS-F59071]